MTTPLSLIEKLRLGHTTTGHKMLGEAADHIELLDEMIDAQDKVISDCDKRIAELEKALGDIIKAKEQWMFTQRLIAQAPSELGDEEK